MTTASKRTVLITGASGYVASLMLPEFRQRYDLRLVDITDKGRDGKRMPDVSISDLSNPDRSGYFDLFRGVDAVIHLGYKRSSEGGVYGTAVPQIDRFDVELSNVQMANNVYRCSYDAGVRRVVMASSNHAADWYEHALIHNRSKDMVFPDEMPLSDNFYGWSKAAYELLGHPYATGVFGRKLEVVQVRIGNPYETDGPKHMREGGDEQHGGSGAASFKRNLGAHFSARDLRQLFMKAVETPDIENEHGVPWLVVYGISGNTRAFWSLESARNVLGYQPEDDSEIKFADDIHRFLTGAESKTGPGKVGA